MTKAVSKPKKDITKKYTKEDARKLVIDLSRKQIDPEDKLKKVANETMERIYAEDKRVTKNDSKLVDELAKDLSLDTGVVLAESIYSSYRGLAIQLKRDIEKEYQCNLSSEKALVDQLVNAYVRKLYYSGIMQSYDTPRYISNEHVGLLNFYSKEIDKAHRQFISGLETLKAMKQPDLKLSIKAKQAYFANNQQVNNKEKINVSK
ncbi:MAG: hypothetical protein GF335_04840 [Candidatus Moranbacteria bacterium]|nr:hypothetical protein [Candidatus Moranbacteria bacterium]